MKWIALTPSELKLVHALLLADKVSLDDIINNDSSNWSETELENIHSESQVVNAVLTKVESA